MIMDLPLDPKTQLLVALGAAAAAKCQSCFAKLHATADQVGVTDKEIRAVVVIASKVAAKARQFMTSFIEEVMHGTATTPSSTAATTGCGCS
jgi:AhpD family alkylhydroperoxidase